MSIRTWLAGLLLPVPSLYSLGAFLAGALLLPLVSSPIVEAKTPGSTYCYHSTCHRVKTVLETEELIGREELLQASFYDDCSRDRYNPCALTSSGEVFRPYDADNAASPIYPDGTTLLVRNPANQETAVVRVNNAGPYWGKRKLDVSRGVAEKLGFKKRGVANLEVRVVKAPKVSETRYRKHRQYDAVPGYIGRFASAETANAGMTAFMAMETLATALLQPVAVVASLADGKEPEARPAAKPEYAATVRSRIAKSSRSARGTRVASRGKGYGKRTTASSKKSHGKMRYASHQGKRGKSKLAYKGRAKATKLALAKKPDRPSKSRHAKRHGRSSIVAWNKPFHNGWSKTAQRRGTGWLAGL